MHVTVDALEEGGYMQVLMILFNYTILTQFRFS